MKKYEYKTIRRFVSYEEMNELGSMGFELISCSIYMEKDGKKFYNIFKKEILSEETKPKFVGLITDEFDNQDIGYSVCSDVDDMLIWKKEMLECNGVKDCKVYELKEV